MTRSEITLNIGGRYSVKVSDVDDTVGAFRGYCALGVDTAIVIEMDGGGMGFIPIPQIVMIDVLDSGVSSDDDRKIDVNYG